MIYERRVEMKKVVAMFALCLVMSGCATSGNIWKEIAGTSTQEIEETRVDAVSKVFEYDYKTCYFNVEKLLNKMPKISIYSKDNSTIAVYFINPDTTPVGLFFKEIDSTHTQVEISSPSTPAKEWVAKNIFTETVQEPQKLITKGGI